MSTTPDLDLPAARRGRRRSAFARMTENNLIWRLLRESLPNQRKAYGIAVLAMIVVAGTAAGTAWIMGEIVDSMADPTDRVRIFTVAALVLLVFVARGIASYVQVVFMSSAGNCIVADKQSQLYACILGQDVGFFNRNESSELLMRMTQSAQVARSVIDTIVTGFVRDTLTLIGLLAVMFYQQPILSLFCLTFGPLVILAIRKILARVREIMSQEMAGISEIIRVVQETSAGAKVVKTFALEDKMAERMNFAIRKVESRANRIVRLEAATSPLLDTLTGLAIAGIVVLSAVGLFGQSAGSPGQLMSFVTALMMAYEPAKRISRMRISIESGLVAVAMMYELIDQPVTMHEHPEAKPLPHGPGEVRLENVRFGYEPNLVVLDDVSFVFEAGKTTALVGPSGAGKSTIINMILRLFDPSQGQVLIDGADIRTATFSSLRQKISFVGQDTFLFSSTVMENIRIGRPNTTDEEVIAAARTAHADEFISGLLNGYGTHVGENGALLSGGQRQRVAIARALLRRAPVLLLDEATSALDSHSEQLVRDALSHVTKGVTTIVIAHRLSTVLNADRVCYVEKGQIVESGTVPDLLSRPDGRFRTLFDQQFGKGQILAMAN